MQPEPKKPINVPAPSDTPIKEVEKPAKKSLVQDLKPRVTRALQFLAHYQVPIIIITVCGLLAITALRMLHYTSPDSDPNRVQENLGKVKQVKIDPKIVDRIKQLDSTNTSTKTDIESGRTNPFSEQ